MFIYVFTEQERDQLKSQGLRFLTECSIGDKLCYVFENDTKLKFNNDIKIFRTNKLMF